MKPLTERKAGRSQLEQSDYEPAQPTTHLFLTVVKVRNSIADKGERGRVLDQRLVRDSRLEPRVVVIIQKAAEESRILKRRRQRGHHLGQGRDVTRGRVECRFEGKVDGVVEHAVHGFLLVGRDIRRVTIEDLSDGVNSSGRDKGGPKVLAKRTSSSQPESAQDPEPSSRCLTFRTCLTVSILIASKP